MPKRCRTKSLGLSSVASLILSSSPVVVVLTVIVIKKGGGVLENECNIYEMLVTKEKRLKDIKQHT